MSYTHSHSAHSRRTFPHSITLDGMLNSSCCCFTFVRGGSGWELELQFAFQAEELMMNANPHEREILVDLRRSVTYLVESPPPLVLCYDHPIQFGHLLVVHLGRLAGWLVVQINDRGGCQAVQTFPFNTRIYKVSVAGTNYE